MRWIGLLPEILLAAAAAPSFAALLGGGPRAGRLARGSLLIGVCAALVAAIVTRDVADEFLFQSYRIDPLSQLIKLAVLTGSLLAAMTTRGEDRWAAMRTTSPFFHLVATIALVACASVVDVLALSLALWLASVAAVLVASSVGRWTVLEKVVRRSLAGWFGALAVALAGGLIAAALAQTTRLEGFRLTGIEQPGLMRGALMLWAAGGLWLVAVAPVQLRRLAGDPSGSRAAPMLGGTAMISVGSLLLLRAFALSAPGFPAVATAILLAVAVMPAPLVAAQRFAFSYTGERRKPAIAAAFVAVIVLAVVAWPWIIEAAAEL